MRRRTTRPVLVVAPLLLALALPGALATPDPEGAPGVVAPAAPPGLHGRREIVDGVEVLRLWGTPRERGFAHGFLYAAEIVRGLDASLGAFLAGRQSVYEAQLLPAAKATFLLDARELAEMEGVLAGIEGRFPAADDRTIAFLGRPIQLDDLNVVNGFGDLYALGCSSVAVWGPRSTDGSPLVGRNFDFPALELAIAHQHVRIVAPTEDASHGWVGICHPGGLGVLTGMNDEGVFAAIHDVHVKPELKDLAQRNVPRLLAVRRLLERVGAQGALTKALELCRSWNTLYGNNFLVAAPDSGGGLPAGVLEYDTREDVDRGADIRGPDGGNDAKPFVVCTNHHRSRGTGSCWRYDQLTGACREDDEEPVTVAEMFETTNRAAFPRPDEVIEAARLGTLHQVVAETGVRRLHVRLAGVGENVRRQSPRVFDVGALLADVAASATER